MEFTVEYVNNAPYLEVFSAVIDEYCLICQDISPTLLRGDDSDLHRALEKTSILVMLSAALVKRTNKGYVQIISLTDIERMTDDFMNATDMCIGAISTYRDTQKCSDSINNADGVTVTSDVNDIINNCKQSAKHIGEAMLAFNYAVRKYKRNNY